MKRAFLVYIFPLFLLASFLSGLSEKDNEGSGSHWENFALDLTPQGTFGNVWRQFWLSHWESIVSLASGG